MPGLVYKVKAGSAVGMWCWPQSPLEPGFRGGRPNCGERRAQCTENCKVFVEDHLGC